MPIPRIRIRASEAPSVCPLRHRGRESSEPRVNNRYLSPESSWCYHIEDDLLIHAVILYAGNGKLSHRLTYLKEDLLAPYASGKSRMVVMPSRVETVRNGDNRPITPIADYHFFYAAYYVMLGSYDPFKRAITTALLSYTDTQLPEQEHFLTRMVHDKVVNE